MNKGAGEIKESGEYTTGLSLSIYIDESTSQLFSAFMQNHEMRMQYIS